MAATTAAREAVFSPSVASTSASSSRVMRTVYDLLPPMTREQAVDALTLAAAGFASAGIAWVQDAWVEPDTMQTWLVGAEAGAMTFRANLAWLAEPEGRWREVLPALSDLKARVDASAPEHLTAHTVKFFADGILEGGTAAVLEPYCDCPTSHGIPNWTREELLEAVAECVRLGFQPHIHAIGDAGVRTALDAFEHAIAVHGTANNPVMAHCQLVDPADLDRFRQLGVIANFEPLWAQLEAEQTVYLCSCGASAKKPFCDGSHLQLSSSTPKVQRPWWKLWA